LANLNVSLNDNPVTTQHRSSLAGYNQFRHPLPRLCRRPVPLAICNYQCGFARRIRATLKTGFHDFYAIVQMSQFTQPIDPKPSLQEVQ